MTKYTRDQVKALANVMNHAKGQNKPFAFLTGAGCSISAGVPAALGILKVINDSGLGGSVQLKLGVDDVAKAEYGKAMAILNSQERKEIIGPLLEEAKVNWGHIALAQLMDAGYVGRVLTFNFDSVLARACGLIGRYPAIYDFSMVPEHNGQFDYIAQPSIIHLHGQGTSLTMMNSEAETQSHAEKLAPLFKDTLQQFNLVVIGYSGQADGAFERLRTCASGQRRLYWCEYADVDTPDHVQGLIDNCKTMGEYWSGVDFDVLMVEIAQELGVFPPAIFKNPALHLLDEIAPIVPMPEEIKGGAGLLDDLREKLESCSKIKPVIAAVRQALMLQQKWQEAIDLGQAEDDNNDDKSNLAWAYVMRAAKSATDDDFYAAFKDYEVALAIKPDIHEALFNWGNALGKLAARKRDEGLYAQAFAKFEAALSIKPDKDEAFSNWGIALGELAALKQDEGLYAQAFAKYEAALAIKPDDNEALYNWGNALGELAALKQDASLYAQAFAKYETALAIKMDMHEALCNWGTYLAKLAAFKQDESHYTQAFAKYEAALAIKPDMYQALFNWGNALSELATLKQDEGLYAQAFAKYETALTIKPDKYEALCNWGNALGELAALKQDETIFAKAFAKYEAALAIKPDLHEPLHNWGGDLLKLYSIVRDKDLLIHAERRLQQAEKLSGQTSYNLARVYALLDEEEACKRQLLAYSRDHTHANAMRLLADEDLSAYRDRDWFKELIETLPDI